MNTLTQTQPFIEFDLPENLACPEPTEERNITRDEVRLLVTAGPGEIHHTTFNKLYRNLEAGDVLVVNTSATVASALTIPLPGGRKGKLHFSNKLNDNEWLIEIREVTGDKTKRWKEGLPGMRFNLSEGSRIDLKRRFYKDKQLLNLWVAELQTSLPEKNYLSKYAQPINYENLNKNYPLEYYQTYFSFHPGSAEMPSASRGFTQSLVEKILEKGVVFAPVLLHTGISSLEVNETPYPEYMEIDPVTSAIINAAKSTGRKIIAAGTTAVRAIESAADNEGIVRPYRGNTELFIDADYKMKVVDGLLTGFHEPRASHLYMLQSIAGFEHVEKAYQVAIESGYYWHQFGDLHLLLPG